MSLLCLPEATLAAANRLGRWLAQDDVAGEPDVANAQLVVLAGNAVMPTVDAACRLAALSGGTLLICGGVGHSTSFLYQTIAQHSRYREIAVLDQPEATLLAEIAHRFWQIPRERIVIEDQSTNCGENAWFTRRVMEQHGIEVPVATLVQDPTMQRRTMATFARVWQGVTLSPRWVSFPGYIPELINTPDGVAWQQPAEGLWPVARYLSLILGELPRLRDDAEGYGPRGKDFIAHVDIPEDVEEAWQRLAAEPRLLQELASRNLR
ncbi:YdcF family protein [Kluyvera intermedia]|uniref:YdcF family protein n=1 Tax=Kluyvera intermedia TaxID=61648 RepID=UPI001F39ADA0|nr:YdcF family protein [Kluyvera intermedia]EKU4732547.1 YdcF family protein [Kluyvera ascorbata]MCE9887611.1 YdcF family protein [Kluyvera intermedia]